MRMGVPREIKNGEHRVALTPQAVAELRALVETHEARREACRLLMEAAARGEEAT